MENGTFRTGGRSMIRVDRSTVREPAKLKRLRDAGLKHASKFFVDTPLAERRQTRYFNPYWQKAYHVPIPALMRLFHEKCAFCESRVSADTPGILDHFRPKWATRGLGASTHRIITGGWRSPGTTSISPARTATSSAARGSLSRKIAFRVQATIRRMRNPSCSIRASMIPTSICVSKRTPASARSAGAVKSRSTSLR